MSIAHCYLRCLHASVYVRFSHDIYGLDLARQMLKSLWNMVKLKTLYIKSSASAYENMWDFEDRRN